ncbi:MAG: hypothetical protein NVSMB29_08390 [Candidatus Dormibacteria bacterium]
MGSDLEDRNAFAERLRLQLESRYRGMSVSVESGRFALLMHGSGVNTRVPLTPIHLDCLREPARTSELVATWVRSMERQLTSALPGEFAAGRLLWCVRSQSYLDELARAGDLLKVELGAEMHGFVAESLPGSVMRGVPRQEWESRGVEEAVVREAADRNTAERFSQLAERIGSAPRVPRDGWRLSGDALFQGSVLMVPAVLEAFAQRAGGEVLIAVPDRGLALALPLSSDRVSAFTRRVNQAYREAMTPCSRRLLVTDGARLREAPRETGTRRGPDLMAWLRD